MNATPPRFERYVAIGDSSTEGINDPDGAGGYRGWSRRLAARLAGAQGSLLYANFAVRGRRTREVRGEQLAPALALRPNLASVFTGTNDVIARDFDVREFTSDVAHMMEALVAGGATVITFTLPDLTPLMPLARLLAPRVRAMNDALREAAAGTGAILVDFAAYEVATDRRLWDPDRIHANSAGHARIGDALADALSLPGSDASWKQPLPAHPRALPGAWLAREAAWTARYLLPFAVASAVGITKLARPEAKHPALEAVTPAG